MEAVNTFGTQLRAARISAAQTNRELLTHEGAAEALGVGQGDTVSRWERDAALPSNMNVIQCAIFYHAPELLRNYCALCPVGQQLKLQGVQRSPLEQVALGLFNKGRHMQVDLLRLMEIAQNGRIDEGERGEYDQILRDMQAFLMDVHKLELFQDGK